MATRVVRTRIYLRVRFVPRDLWIGVFVEEPDYASLTQRTFICLLPCLPIIVTRPVRAFR